MFGQISGGALVLLEVQADSGTGHAGAREPEDYAGPVLEDDADALVLRDAPVDGVLVLEDVVHLDLHAMNFRSSQSQLAHVFHHLLRLGLVDTLIVVAGIVVAPILLPVLVGNILHSDQLAGGLTLGREHLQPGQHCPHAILLTDVICTSSEGLLATDERGVLLRLWKILRIAAVHKVAEELPARGCLETLDAFLLGHKVKGARGGHGAGTALEAVLELWDEVRVCHKHGQ
mmetsp:Transcript_32074/g.95535  ORF Transcript_32074/g.95535 Transcript_32074/m.95535 type:complete len:231 (-) Transcript_32074:1074-1766(-)